MRRAARVLVAVGLLSCSRQGGPAPPDGAAARPAEPLRVAAAADLALAFREVGAAFERRHGVPVTFSFGSTGLLAKQVIEGAPFDVLAAANVSFVEDIVNAGAGLADTKALYARGRLVLYAPRSSAVAPPRSLEELTDPRFRKIAIANPEHAPYGRAARQALERARLWDRVQPRVVYAENIQQAKQFADTGNADVAIVSLSLLSGVAVDAAVLPVDDSLHAPIDQALVVTRRAAQPAAARRFAAFVNGPEGRAILRRFGFALPGEAAR